MLVRRRSRRARDSGETVCLLASRYDDPDFDPYSDPDIPDVPSESDEIPAIPRDGYVDLAKAELEELFEREPRSVFYQRQLQVMFEREFFHWVTVRALTELVEEGKIASDVMPLEPAEGEAGAVNLAFYRSITYRYWKRKAYRVMELVSRFSKASFTSALGTHGEMMFDAALPRVGFMPTKSKVRSYGGVEWDKTQNDLDRVFERDGIAYGTEIKNTLSYIDKDELAIKVEMCKHLGLRPLFIVRMAPKSYVDLVEKEGGFTLIFKFQLYPFGQKAFANEVREQLRLPTDSPRRIEDGTVNRLLNWHLAHR